MVNNVFRIHKEINCADTSRDLDDIHTTELGFAETIDIALNFVEDHIKKHFFRKDATIKKCNDGSYIAIDVCSYGAIIYITPIGIIE